MKSYYLRFGSGDPRQFTGLSPSFISFVRSDGQTIAPPSITEFFSGSGVYKFDFGTTQSIAFLADAATILPGMQGRYVWGAIDPSDRADEYGNTLIAYGSSSAAANTTLIAISTSLAAQGVTFTVTIAGIGGPSSTFGSNISDPIDLFGYMKRVIENLEGNQTFIKPSGALTQYSRGSSVTLYSKIIANSASTVVKS